MKNITVLVEPSEVARYVDSLWQTGMFKNSPFVTRVVEEFARLPRIFADMSNPILEKAHFSTWWNVIMRRTYENPFVHDLYLLHEMYHAARMPYVPGIGKAAFDEKMQRNELEASVLSEIQVYFEMPGLRAESFKHDIYADRFLNDPKMQALWANDPVVAIETIRTIRRDVMVSKPVEGMDLTETWIRRFADQNAVFTITWADRYGEIEQRMADFQYRATEDRQAAIDEHTAWLAAEVGSDDTGEGVPFRQEAEIFSGHYWANAARYDAAVRAGAKPRSEERNKDRFGDLEGLLANCMTATESLRKQREEKAPNVDLGPARAAAEAVFEHLMKEFDAPFSDLRSRQECHVEMKKAWPTQKDGLNMNALRSFNDTVIGATVIRFMLSYMKMPIDPSRSKTFDLISARYRDLVLA